MIRRTPRTGLTLTEVLVAMFVMALGMIALLTLFPLGAMQVGDALRMDRCTQAATSADAVIRMHWRHNVVAPVATNNGRPFDAFVWDGMDDPNLIQMQFDTVNSPSTGLFHFQYPLPTFRLGGGIPGASWGNTDPNPNQNLISYTSLRMDTGSPSTNPNPGPVLSPYPTLVSAIGRSRNLAGNPNRLPSFPLLIDPVGAIARAGTAGQFWTGGNASTVTPLATSQRFLVPRRVPNFCFFNNAMSSTTTANYFIMSDDLAFEKNGAPDPLGVLNRQGRYNWAAMIQRPQFDNRTVADLKIMVFDGRAPGVASTEDELVVSTSWTNNGAPPTDPTQSVTIAPLYLTAGSKSVALLIPARGQNSPALIRRGGWIMDGTTHVDEASGLTGPRSIRNANFYRIVGVQSGEEGSGPLLTLPNGTQVPSTAYLLDLETAIKGPTTLTMAQLTAAGFPNPPYTRDELPAQIYLFANLSEVFERPPLRIDSGN
jgi:hypothetical protein